MRSETKLKPSALAGRTMISLTDASVIVIVRLPVMATIFGVV